jgi:F0F1-type ATP synthase assembly protein I
VERVDTDGKRELYSGFGNAMGMAVELAGAPIIFGLFGWWLDHRLGTGHLLFLLLTLFAVVGLAVKTYYTYVHQMDQHEAGQPWKRT